MADWEVVAVEEPFVLSLGKDLPPCLGVVDLVVRQGSRYAVVDHKTGKSFSADRDDLQLVLYREYVRRHYRAAECLTIFDEYRWVNNLDRIRKPAFRRTSVELLGDAWTMARAELAEAHRNMRSIRKASDATSDGPCFLCPFKALCRHASDGYESGWSYEYDRGDYRASEAVLVGADPKNARSQGPRPKRR